MKNLEKLALSLDRLQSPIKEPRNRGREMLVGGLSATGITASILGAGGLMTKKSLPGLSSMLMNAGKEGVKFLNPVRTVKTFSNLRTAVPMFQRQMHVNERMLSNTSIPKVFDAADNGLLNYKNIPKREELDELVKLQKEFKGMHDENLAYFKNHGERPHETIERSVGMMSGLASLGGGAAASQISL